MGSTVVQWLALVPHSGVCMFCLFSCGFPSGTLASYHHHVSGVWLIGHSKLLFSTTDMFLKEIKRSPNMDGKCLKLSLNKNGFLLGIQNYLKYILYTYA